MRLEIKGLGSCMTTDKLTKKPLGFNFFAYKMRK